MTEGAGVHFGNLDTKARPLTAKDALRISPRLEKKRDSPSATNNSPFSVFFILIGTNCIAYFSRYHACN